MAAAIPVLVVDDEAAITDLVSLALKYEGFDPHTAASAAEARVSVLKTPPALIILDVGLPDEDGFALMHGLRKDGNRTPIIFLSARDTTSDKVRGLTVGGDDYITKPFSIEELIARVRAVLRRHEEGRATDNTFAVADLTLDDDTHEVRRGDRQIQLTATEFRLLRYLLINAGHVVSRSQILDHVWKYNYDGDMTVIDTYISYVRRKIDTGHTRLIHTVRGVGFILRIPSVQP